eukprot:scaffold13357_cov194-Alexandrium_tamarense.AAC.9
MKLDMATRSAKGSVRSPAGSVSTAATASINNNNTNRAAVGTPSTNVAHVVRVTFLGVAGILAKKQDESPANKAAEQQHQQINAPASTTCDPNHPSLLFPLPTDLRVVATVSRTRTARGIPSGMSKCLVASHLPSDNRQASTIATDSTPAIDVPNGTVCKGSSESILNQSVEVGNNHENHTIGGHSVALSVANPTGPGGTVPPSQFLHGRATSVRSHVTSRSRDSAESVQTEILAEGEGATDAEMDGMQESIEVVDPMLAESPAGNNVVTHLAFGASSDLDRAVHEKLTLGENEIVEDETDAVPERYIAVWDEEAEIAKLNARSATPSADKEAAASGEKKLQFMNTSNTLAFEAELRPSSTSNAKKRPSTPVSAVFAPKSFCVTVGLVPDYTENSNNNNSSDKSSGKEQSESLPAFAIPVGFADLVITGHETLDGKQLQLDLPLASLNHFIGSFGGQSGPNLECPFPLMELTAEVADTKSKDNANPEEKKGGSSKPKKKSIVSRMFSRSKYPKSGGSDPHADAMKDALVYSGDDPRSIFQLGRPPNAKERNLFLERFNVDPSGDAVVRIGLEVFPRGSDLEKLFRQRNKLRRELLKKKAATARKSPGIITASSMGEMSRTTSGGTGQSLIDDEEALLDSDSDSDDSQSFFSLDSERSETTWDQSTMFTAETSSSYNSISGSFSFASDVYSESGQTIEEKERSKPRSSYARTPQNVFGRMFDCKLEGAEEASSPSSTNNRTFPAKFTNLLTCSGSHYVQGNDDTAKRFNIDAVMSGEESEASDSTPMSKTPKGGNHVSLTTLIHHQNATTDALATKEESGKGLNIPLAERTVTLKSEESPLASIKVRQRVNLNGIEEEAKEVGKVEQEQAEGQEFTLEELSHSM